MDWRKEKQLKQKAQEYYEKGLSYNQVYIHGYVDGYAKAVDEFAERLKEEYKQTITTSSAYCYESFDEVVDEIAEQLKR